MAIFNNGVDKNKTLGLIPLYQNADAIINITPASEFVPEWYRKSSSKIIDNNDELILNHGGRSVSVNATYKKCTPFFDAMTMGYMVFLSSDIEVVKNNNGETIILHRTHKNLISDHSLSQWKDMPSPEGYVPFLYKFLNNFGIKTPKGYSSLFISPINRFDLPFITVSGVVDTDTYDIGVHFPFFIKDNFTGIIEKGTPITQILPFKRDKWNRNVEKYDRDKIETKDNLFLSHIKRSYKNNYWTRKEYR